LKPFKLGGRPRARKKKKGTGRAGEEILTEPEVSGMKKGQTYRGRLYDKTAPGLVLLQLSKNPGWSLLRMRE